MVTIRINGVHAEVQEGSRLIDAIRQEGIKVPSLCYKPGMEHYTSCMVCVVKDNVSGKFIPSCSAVVTDDMDIDASGPSVAGMRAEAVRMLLVEHRAECEAPCKLVCPCKLDIPLMNRLLTAGETAKATALAFSVLGDPVAVCTACKGYCDKACRRKRIDSNVAIKSTIIYLSAMNSSASGLTTGEGKQVSGSRSPASVHQPPEISHRHFNSTLGVVTDDEFREWLKEAAEGAASHPNPSTEAEAIEEASRCLHCDCRAIADCRLRDIAHELGVKNPRVKHTAFPVVKKINPVSGLVFEHAKCIKCGLCVRLGDTLTGQPTLTFRGRGYETIISEPLYHKFVDILNDAACRFAEICPTGALALIKETT